VVLIEPFLTIGIWSIILAVVLYPFFAWMVKTLHLPGAVAALLLTALGLAVLLGPAAVLGVSLVDTVGKIAVAIRDGAVTVPAPPDAVKDWPLVGDTIYDTWSLASTNLGAALTQIVPALKPYSSTLLGFAGSTSIGMVKFVTAVVISGFLLVPAPALVGSARSIFLRISAVRGNQFVDLIGATIRNLARGLIGLSLLQALLAGIGFLIAGVPAAGFFSFLILVLGIVQIDAAIVAIPLMVWAWLKLSTTAALIFTIYMIPVSLLNNFLRPFVMAHGLKTPMIVIFVGVLGGILANGVIGLFIGPVVLAIAWEVIKAWTQPDDLPGEDDDLTPTSL
jgi:predicted PurR-regulated permease PerM